jgi:hypothetical protein
MTKQISDLAGRVEREIADSFDEELEMEIDDERLARLLSAEASIRPPRIPSSAASISRSCSACRASW